MDAGDPEDLTPEFGPPIEPLVVPDNDPILPPEPKLPFSPLGKFKNPPCRTPKKDGSPCRFPAQKNGWCWAHDPDKKAKLLALAAVKVKKKKNIGPYKDREELLAVLSARLDRFLNKHGEGVNMPPGVTPIQELAFVDSWVKVEHTICHIIKTMATVMTVEVAEGSDIKGWQPRPRYERIDAPDSAVG